MKSLFATAIFLFLFYSESSSQPPPRPMAPSGTRPVKKWEQPSLSTIKPTDEYKSWEGRFRIKLPKESLSGYSSITPKSAGRNVAGGQYSFRLKEGSFLVQFQDHLDREFANMSIEEVDRRLSSGVVGAVQSTRGTKLTDEKISVGPFLGRKVKIALSSGGNLLARIYFVGSRLYMVVGQVFNPNAADEALADNALASFALVSSSEIDAEVAEAVKVSTPKLLPQTPVSSKEKSDAEDANLKGRVKKVIGEDQDLSGTWQFQSRKRSSEEEFNDKGNLVKRISFDSTGFPFEVTVYGFIDGNRVTDSKTITSGSVLTISGGAPLNNKPRDNRYDFKRLYEYKNGRLAQEQLIQNNGDLWMKYVYSFSGNEMTELVYSENGKLNQKYRYRYDDRGNAVDYSSYEAFVDPNTVKRRYRYRYDKFDENGNWLQRTQFEIVAENGEEKEKPSQVEYRSIVYFP